MDEEIKEAVLNAGIDLRNAITLKINSNIPPPNAPSTIKHKKGSTKTLVDTGTLLGSVDVLPLEEGDDFLVVGVGVFDEGVAGYAAANEYGSVRTVTTKNKDNKDEMHQGFSTVVIPERSFMRSAYDENVETILNKLEEEVGRIVSKKFME
jgi:hypothetical protein